MYVEGSLLSVDKLHEDHLSGSVTNNGILEVIDYHRTFISDAISNNGVLLVFDTVYISPIIGYVISDSISIPGTGPFIGGNILGSEDLKLSIWESRWSDGTYGPDTWPAQTYQLNPIWANYSIRGFDSSNDTTGWLDGYKYRTPMSPMVGEFYASMVAPYSSGRYQIRWLYQRDESSFVTERIQEFNITGSGIN
jgi:hypothetical protein